MGLFDKKDPKQENQDGSPDPNKDSQQNKDSNSPNKLGDLSPEALKALGLLPQFMQYSLNAFKQLSERVDGIGGSGDSGDDDGDADEGDSKDTKVPDLENMNRQEYTQFLLGEFGKLVDSKLKPLSEEFSDARAGVERRFAKQDIDSAAEKYSDFDKFQGEIAEQLKRRPDLSIEEAYVLARLHNSEKASESDKEAQSAAEEARKKAEAEKAESFGGILPTSGRVRSSESMDSEKAANAAWQEQFGNIVDPHAMLEIPRAQTQ